MQGVRRVVPPAVFATRRPSVTVRSEASVACLGRPWDVYEYVPRLSDVITHGEIRVRAAIQSNRASLA